MDYDEKVGIQFEHVVERRMSNGAVVCLGRALLAPLVLMSGVAAAGSLAGVVQPTVTTSPLTSMGSLPALPAAASLSAPASIGAMNVQGQAALPGLEAVADSQHKQPATRTGVSTNAIRPIRVPPNVLPITLPVTLPLVSGS